MTWTVDTDGAIESVWIPWLDKPGIETDSLGDNAVEGRVVTGRLLKVRDASTCGAVF